MTEKITATFKCKQSEDSGSSNVVDYDVYVFTEIRDSDGNEYEDKWFKRTRLLETTPLIKEDQYRITLSEKPYSDKAQRLPYPIEIIDSVDRHYMKRGNLIIHVDENGVETKILNPLSMG